MFVIMPFEQSREPAASTGSSQAPTTTRSQAQVANDAKVMEFMKTKFVKMEQDLKSAQNELRLLKMKPALATQREDYVLGEMELVNRQLDCEFEFCSVYKLFCIAFSFWFDWRACFAGFVDNFQAEEARVEKRLDSVVGDPTTGGQHFWLDKYHARILAKLKDRVWRSTILLELCRAAFTRINQTLFPTGPQPQGIHALLDLFRHAGPIRELLTQKLVDGANAAMAYVRSRRPHLQLTPPAVGATLSQADLDGTVASARTLVERHHAQLFGPVLPVKDEPEN